MEVSEAHNINITMWENRVTGNSISINGKEKDTLKNNRNFVCKKQQDITRYLKESEFEEALKSENILKKSHIELKKWGKKRSED
jgi:hypothetical protein